MSVKENKKILLEVSVESSISKSGNSYEFLLVRIPIPGSEPIEKRLYDFSPVELAVLKMQ